MADIDTSVANDGPVRRLRNEILRPFQWHTEETVNKIGPGKAARLEQVEDITRGNALLLELLEQDIENRAEEDPTILNVVQTGALLRYLISVNNATSNMLEADRATTEEWVRGIAERAKDFDTRR